MASSPQEYFEQDIARKLREKPEVAQKINAVYQFNVTGENGGNWTVDMVTPEVRPGEDPGARCTVTVKDEDLMKIVNGQMNPQMAFMSGKLKVGGDMGLAMKLGDVLRA